MRWWLAGKPVRNGRPVVHAPRAAAIERHAGRLEDFTWLRTECGEPVARAGARVGVRRTMAWKLEAERKRNSAA